MVIELLFESITKACGSMRWEQILGSDYGGMLMRGKEAVLELGYLFLCPFSPRRVALYIFVRPCGDGLLHLLASSMNN